MKPTSDRSYISNTKCNDVLCVGATAAIVWVLRTVAGTHTRTVERTHPLVPVRWPAQLPVLVDTPCGTRMRSASTTWNTRAVRASSAARSIPSSTSPRARILSLVTYSTVLVLDVALRSINTPEYKLIKLTPSSLPVMHKNV